MELKRANNIKEIGKKRQNGAKREPKDPKRSNNGQQRRHNHARACTCTQARRQARGKTHTHLL